MPRILLMSLAWFGTTTATYAFTPILLSTAIKSSKTRSVDSSSLSKDELQAIQLESERLARERHDNEVWNALFVSVPERPEPTPCSVPDAASSEYGTMCEQTLPSDFPPGCLLRIGPNGGTKEDGFLDADGMIQCITFPPTGRNNDDASTTTSTSQFSSTYVETAGRIREAELGYSERYKGSLGSAPRGFPLLQNLVSNMIAFRTIQGQKDTANTAIAEHGGRVLALMEQAPPTEIAIDRDGTVRTIQPMTRLDGAIPMSDPITGGNLGAHGRTCPKSGDRVHVSYSSSSAPFVRVDTFEQGANTGWKLKYSIPVNTPTPVMVHDIAITENYAVILDFPLTVRPMRMLLDQFPVEYEPSNGARIGLVPRTRPDVQEEDVLWFDCDPCVVLHTVNAFETDDGKVVLYALRSQPKGEGSYITEYATAFLYEWILDLESGKTIEQCLNPEELVEFPVIDDRYVSSDVDAVYCSHVSTIGGPLKVYKQPREGIKIDGIVKFALRDHAIVKKGDVIGRFTLPDSWYAVSEPTVVPKVGCTERSAYVLMVATQVHKEELGVRASNEGRPLRSQLLVLDGERFDAGPVYALDLPHHVPYGLHSEFLEWDKLK